MESAYQRITFSNEKLEANKKANPQIGKMKKPVLIVAAVISFLAVLILGTLFIPGRKLFKSTVRARQTASELYTLGKNQDIDAMKGKVNELKVDLAQVENDLKGMALLKIIPVINSYYADSLHLVKGGIHSVEAVEITIETIIPYADLLGLKGESTFVSGSADERIKTAVETLDKIVPKIDEIGAKLSLAEKEIEAVDFNRYPQKLGKHKVREPLTKGKQLFAETASLFVNAQPLLKNLPDLLGNKESRRYLVIFQNDAELRATGGFMTAFAIFKVDKGKLQVERSDDIYKLDEAKKKTFPAPEKILTYHKDVKNYQLRDSNLSPDFSLSMKEFEKLLKESNVDLGEYEGIIALDTHVLVSTINILGDFVVAGRTFSAENDNRCDCPKAIYELEDYSTRPVAFLRDDRKGIIGTLLYQMMQKALGVSPGQYWGKLSQMLLNEAREKHVLFYFHDSQAQKGIEGVNFGGRIRDFDKDYLHINNVNFAGAKSNLFVENSVKQEITKEGTNYVKFLTLNYKNPAPASNCNLEAGQLCLNGILRNWLRIYVPKGSKLIEFKGSEMATKSYDELGKTVFEGFVTVKPQGSTTVNIKYSLPLGIKDDPFELLVQKQAGTDNDEYQISLNGKEQKVNLTSDQQILFN